MISLSTMIGKFFFLICVILLFITFQSEVFGTLSSENEAQAALPEESDFNRLKAQRAAKRARLATIAN